MSGCSPNNAGFAAVRFLLGFFEGAVSPAFVTITSIWYRSNEHAVRTALWVSMNGVAQVFGCLLMYGIGKNTSLGLAPWRIMFLVCSALTVFSGVLFYLIMPSSPKDAWFLNAHDKEVLTARMAQDREGGDKTDFSMSHLKEAMLDPKPWIVFFFGVLITMPSPVLTFATLTINSLGYTKTQTMFLTAPSGAVQVLVLWIGAALCHLMPKNRTIVVCIPSLVGNLFLMKLPLESSWGIIVSACFVSSPQILLIWSSWG